MVKKIAEAAFLMCDGESMDFCTQRRNFDMNLEGWFEKQKLMKILKNDYDNFYMLFDLDNFNFLQAPNLTIFNYFVVIMEYL